MENFAFLPSSFGLVVCETLIYESNPRGSCRSNTFSQCHSPPQTALHPGSTFTFTSPTANVILRWSLFRYSFGSYGFSLFRSSSRNDTDKQQHRTSWSWSWRVRTLVWGISRDIFFSYPRDNRRERDRTAHRTLACVRRWLGLCSLG